MKQLSQQLLNDEAGFIVSAELVLIASIVVIGMIVGLSEVAFNINQELEDVGSAFGSVNQTYSFRQSNGTKGGAFGSQYEDSYDEGDDWCDVSCNGQPQAEY